MPGQPVSCDYIPLASVSQHQNPLLLFHRKKSLAFVKCLEVGIKALSFEPVRLLTCHAPRQLRDVTPIDLRKETMHDVIKCDWRGCSTH